MPHRPCACFGHRGVLLIGFLLVCVLSTPPAGKGGALALNSDNLGTEAMVQAITIAKQSGAIRGSVAGSPRNPQGATNARKSSWTNRVSDWLQSKRSLVSHDSLNAVVTAEAPDANL